LFSDFIINQQIELSMINFSKKENRNAEKWANAAAIAVAIRLQKPLKPLYCGYNVGCRPQLRTMH
jgi:hypothetical protein